MAKKMDGCWQHSAEVRQFRTSLATTLPTSAEFGRPWPRLARFGGGKCHLPANVAQTWANVALNWSIQVHVCRRILGKFDLVTQLANSPHFGRNMPYSAATRLPGTYFSRLRTSRVAHEGLALRWARGAGRQCVRGRGASCPAPFGSDNWWKRSEQLVDKQVGKTPKRSPPPILLAP